MKVLIDYQADCDTSGENRILLEMYCGLKYICYNGMFVYQVVNLSVFILAAIKYGVKFKVIDEQYVDNN